MNVQRRPLAWCIRRFEHRQRIACLRAPSLEDDFAAERVLNPFAPACWNEECVHGAVVSVSRRRAAGSAAVGEKSDVVLKATLTGKYLHPTSTGTGASTITVEPTQVCWKFAYKGLDQAGDSGIHIVPPPAPGSHKTSVFPFTASTSTAPSCVSRTAWVPNDAKYVDRIAADPSHFFWSGTRCSRRSSSVPLPGVEVIASFDDGPALWDAVVARGLDGVVAKREREPYRPGARLWVKTKNRATDRFREELAGAQWRRSAH